MEQPVFPLICDPVEGFCGLPQAIMVSELVDTVPEPTVRIMYFTDPICSSCWGIEPALRKLKLAYGNSVHTEYYMGGLLPNWNYNSGGISKPADVAHHWDEVSQHYDMPIDGDLWLEDPLHSSYPPSIAFKAAQMQDTEKALLFLRVIKEMVFLQKKNITKWAHLAAAAVQAGLNEDQLKTDMEGEAKNHFEADLKLARELGVRGFPTLFFVDKNGQKEIMYGTKTFEVYEAALLKAYPEISKQTYDQSWQALFEKYNSLTAKEFSELADIPRTESESLLNELADKHILRLTTTKNGNLWTLNPLP